MQRSIGKKMLMFCVVIIAFQDVAAGVAGSIMADIIKAYPEYNPTIVMMVATFPGLVQIVPALFYGKLSKKFNKRTLLFTGLTLFIVGGTLPTFIDSLPLIILMRGILGLGVGITMPLSIDIITDFFEGRERDFLIGFGTSTIACIGAIFFQLGGGMLADAYGWHYGFLTYLFPLWILAVTFLYLPEPEKKVHQQATNTEGKKLKLPKAVYWTCLGQVLYSSLIFGYVTNISVVIQGDNLGNATEAGMAISVFTFGTLLVGFLFGKIKHRLPRMYLPVGIGFTGLGMVICYFSPSLTMILVGSLIGGAGMGIGIPGVFTRVTELAPAAIASAGVGLVVAAQGVGGIAGPFGFQVIQNIFNQDIGRFPLAISAVGLIILAIIWALGTGKAPSKDLEVTLTQ
ncbi:MFS transporter [Neobacillus sp. FSL H8-0543]|uniref:MFS transporter n=1 Tax=Neobacillus sp. FSL H8-0543 TaxID=2954672 RepID=UPI003158EA8C